MTKLSENTIYFHVDVNSAFLAWDATWRLDHGEALDLRTIPSIVGGSQATRHGIVLAKSTPAKRYKIHTGEPVTAALSKCPNLTVVPPRYDIYEQASHALMEYLRAFSPTVERFSVDEAFVEYTGLGKLHGDPEAAAKRLSQSIKRDLGFTVNVGVSTNKLLAKMAGELDKPDKVITLWPHEVKKKLWSLPINELYMVGRRTEKKLTDMGVITIGDLATQDPKLIEYRLKSPGLMLWHFANGHHVDTGKGGAGNFQGMIPNTADTIGIKGMGNSATIAFDVKDKDTAYQVILSLAETVSSRLRENQLRAHVVYVSYATHDFRRFARQSRYSTPTASTSDIYQRAIAVFDTLWDEAPIRQMGVWTGGFTQHQHLQTSFINQSWKAELADHAVDSVRRKYGDGAVMRGSMLQSRIRHMIGGTASNRHFLNETVK